MKNKICREYPKVNEVAEKYIEVLKDREYSAEDEFYRKPNVCSDYDDSFPDGYFGVSCMIKIDGCDIQQIALTLNSTAKSLNLPRVTKFVLIDDRSLSSQREDTSEENLFLGFNQYTNDKDGNAIKAEDFPHTEQYIVLNLDWAYSGDI